MKEKEEKIVDTYPMRINKYLSHRGISTRLGADALVKEGKIYINGKRAKLGDKVEEKDKVDVKGKPKSFVYFAYNKPKSIVTTNPQNEEKDIKSIIKTSEKLFPVGRLDKDSTGLIILTNDGRVTDRLLNPDKNHEKEYVVELDRKYSPGFIKHMQEGVNLGDFITKKAKVKKMGEKVFSITLTEGKNRQIRRMTEKLGFTVRTLRRVRIQNIELGKLKENTLKPIEGKEKEEFLISLGLK